MQVIIRTRGSDRLRHRRSRIGPGAGIQLMPSGVLAEDRPEKRDTHALRLTDGNRAEQKRVHAGGYARNLPAPRRTQGCKTRKESAGNILILLGVLVVLVLVLVLVLVFVLLVLSFVLLALDLRSDF